MCAFGSSCIEWADDHHKKERERESTLNRLRTIFWETMGNHQRSNHGMGILISSSCEAWNLPEFTALVGMPEVINLGDGRQRDINPGWWLVRGIYYRVFVGDYNTPRRGNRYKPGLNRMIERFRDFGNCSFCVDSSGCFTTTTTVFWGLTTSNHIAMVYQLRSTQFTSAKERWEGTVLREGPPSWDPQRCHQTWLGWKSPARNGASTGNHR